MSKRRTSRRNSSARVKQVLSLIDLYVAETGDDSGNYDLIAQWLHDEKKYRLPKYDPVKVIRRALTSCSRQDYIVNENGDPVRRRHAYPVSSTDSEGLKQTTFAWFKIEDATPEKMRMSAAARRNGSLLDILQLVRDVDYYNTHYNPGDPIPVEGDFTADIEEARMPKQYPEGPQPSE